MKQINSLEFAQSDEPSAIARLMTGTLQPQTTAVFEQISSNPLTWSQECLETHHLLIPEVRLETDTKCIAQYQLFLENCRLNSNHQNIQQIAKWLVDFLAITEKMVDAICIHYQSRPAFLILSNKRIICLSLANPHQEVRIGFVLQLKGIEAVDTSEQGLEIRRNNIKVKFDDKQQAKRFVDKNLSHFVTVKTQKPSPLLGLLTCVRKVRSKG